MCSLKSSEFPIGEVNLAVQNIHSLRERALYLRKLSQANHVKRMVFARNKDESQSPVFILPSNHTVCETKSEWSARKSPLLNLAVACKTAKGSQANILDTSRQKVSSSRDVPQKELSENNTIANSNYNIVNNYSSVKQNGEKNVAKKAVTSSRSVEKSVNCLEKTVSSNIPQKRISIFSNESPKVSKPTNQDLKETELKKSKIPESTRLMSKDFNTFHKPIATFAIKSDRMQDNNKTNSYPLKHKKFSVTTAFRSFGSQQDANSCASNKKNHNSPDFENLKLPKISLIPTLKLDSKTPSDFRTSSKELTTRIDASSIKIEPVQPAGKKISNSFNRDFIPPSVKKNSSIFSGISADSLEDCNIVSYSIDSKLSNHINKNQVYGRNKYDNQYSTESHQLNNYSVSSGKCDEQKYSPKLAINPHQSKNLKNLPTEAYKIARLNESEVKMNVPQSSNSFNSDLLLFLKSKTRRQKDTDLIIEDKCHITKENNSPPSKSANRTMLITVPEKNTVPPKEVVIADGVVSEEVVQDSVCKSEPIAAENCSRFYKRHSFDALVNYKKEKTSVNSPITGNTAQGNINETHTRSIALNPKILAASKVSGVEEGKQRITGRKLQNILEVKQKNSDVSYSSPGNDFLLKPIEKFMNEITHSMENSEKEVIEDAALQFRRENRDFKGITSKSRFNGISPDSLLKMS